MQLPHFYPITDSLVSVRTLARLGYRLILYRYKQAGAELFKLAKELPALQALGCLVVLNDDLPHALKLGFKAVHLGQEDLQLHRSLLPHAKARGLSIGVSVHNISEVDNALAMEPDYLSFGPLFASTTKTSLVPLPKPEQQKVLHNMKQRFTAPICAIGGINEDNADNVFSMGFDSAAFIAWTVKLVAEKTPAGALERMDFSKRSSYSLTHGGHR